MTYKTLLVPVDPAGCAITVVQHAATLATAFDADVVLLHILAPPPGVHLDDPHLQGTVGDALRAEAHDELSHLAATYTGPRPPRRQVAIGEVAPTILSQITAHGADLVVMGTHGRTGLWRMLRGSVAETVLRSARVPVFVVHAPEGMSEHLTHAQVEVAAEREG